MIFFNICIDSSNSCDSSDSSDSNASDGSDEKKLWWQILVMEKVCEEKCFDGKNIEDNNIVMKFFCDDRICWWQYKNWRIKINILVVHKSKK